MGVWIAIGVIIILLLGGIIFMLIYTTPIAEKVYREYLVNPNPDDRKRECSCVTNEERLAGLQTVGEGGRRPDEVDLKLPISFA